MSSQRTLRASVGSYFSSPRTTKSRSNLVYSCTNRDSMTSGSFEFVAATSLFKVFKAFWDFLFEGLRNLEKALPDDGFAVEATSSPASALEFTGDTSIV